MKITNFEAKGTTHIKSLQNVVIRLEKKISPGMTTIRTTQ